METIGEYSSYYAYLHLEGLKKTTKNWLSRDSKRGLPEYKSRVFTSQSTCLVSYNVVSPY